MLRRIVKFFAWSIGLIVLGIIGVIIYVRLVAVIDERYPIVGLANEQVIEVDTGCLS